MYACGEVVPNVSDAAGETILDIKCGLTEAESLVEFALLCPRRRLLGAASKVVFFHLSLVP
jgi:hypothetical protein